MMAVISRTDFIQGQFAFKTKKNSGSYKGLVIINARDWGGRDFNGA